MKYSDAREYIETGDLLCCNFSGWFSRFIRYESKSDVSHVGVACWLQFNTGQKRLCIFEATDGGIRLYPLYHYLKTDYWPYGNQMWWCPLKDKSISGAGVVDFCLQHWGDGYANLYQFVVGLSPVLQWVRKMMGKSMDTDATRFHCSETVTRALMSQGFNWAKEPALTTPVEVTKFACFGKRILLEPNDAMEIR